MSKTSQIPEGENLSAGDQIDIARLQVDADNYNRLLPVFLKVIKSMNRITTVLGPVLEAGKEMKGVDPVAVAKIIPQAKKLGPALSQEAEFLKPIIDTYLPIAQKHFPDEREDS